MDQTGGKHRLKLGQCLVVADVYELANGCTPTETASAHPLGRHRTGRWRFGLVIVGSVYLVVFGEDG